MCRPARVTVKRVSIFMFLVYKQAIKYMHTKDPVINVVVTWQYPACTPSFTSTGLCSWLNKWTSVQMISWWMKIEVIFSCSKTYRALNLSHSGNFRRKNSETTDVQAPPLNKRIVRLVLKLQKIYGTMLSSCTVLFSIKIHSFMNIEHFFSSPFFTWHLKW